MTFIHAIASACGGAAALAAALIAGNAAAAPASTDRAAPSSALDDARTLLADRAQAAAQALDGRIEVQLSRGADERVRQAPCDPEVVVPPSARPLGRTYFELRCRDHAWMARLQADVSLHARVPVLVRPMQAGSVLQPGDWAEQEIDLADWPRGVATSDRDLAGARLTRTLRVGDPIPVDAAQSRARLGAGEPVQVILVGQGFVVKASGKMLNQASPGQAARAQLDSGRTVAGTLRGDREIEVRL